MSAAQGADQHQRDQHAADQRQDHQRSAEDRADPGDVEQQPAGRQKDADEQHDPQRDDGREDEAEDLVGAEAQGLADGDLFVAGRVHGGDAAMAPPNTAQTSRNRAKNRMK